MPIFFHVDRLCKIDPTREIGLAKFTNITPPILQDHVDKMFPDGVSLHGDRYFLQNSANPLLTNPNIEIFFEFVRRADFPNKPSRFQSLFASETYEEAKFFKENYGNNESKIWKIKAKQFHKGDMSLLTNDCAILVYSYYAQLYWSGEQGPFTPVWEILVKPPVEILKEM